MMNRGMSAPVISTFLFTVTFPPTSLRRVHVPYPKLRSLAGKQLNDAEVIETIDHLFKCQRCFENYRAVRHSFLNSWA